MQRSPFLLVAPFLAAGFVALAMAWPGAPLPASCNSDAATTAFTPITGIIIRSDSLVSGVGCGTGPDQVYRYVALVAPAPTSAGGAVSFQYATVVDCFADGVLLNLSTATVQEFVLDVFAFNEATWSVVGAGLDVADASATSLGALDNSLASQANWRTTCTATEQQEIQVLAVCAPLVAPGAAVDAGLDALSPADAPPDGTADGSGDASVTPDSSTDAPPDAPVDAPADVSADAPSDGAADASTDG